MRKTRAIVVSQVSLSELQSTALAQPTPKQFVKSKPGRGGKQVRYVEGGYVVNQLNRIFGPLNWSFKITERGSTERKIEKNTDGEVWVYGELTVHDHKHGLAVTKGQTGQHPIHTSVPIGDAYKAAGTDSLKKCASLFGIALDIYWGMMDSDRPQGEAPVVPKEAPKAPPGAPKVPKAANSIFERSKRYLEDETDRQVLSNAIQRIDATVELTVAQKYQLKKIVNDKLGIKTSQKLDI